MSRMGHKYRIELAGIEPLIWRKIVVPAEYSFWQLHVAIQDAMGWLDYHLHEFRVANTEIGARETIGIPDGEGYRVLAGWDVPIARFFRTPRTTAQYIYDFGDDWRHTIVFEGAVELAEGAPDLACLGGERACPPEDCGGVYGYERLLEATTDPSDDQYAELTEWLGGPFDANAFSPTEVEFDDPDERWQRAFGGTA